jgi:hypothetical protein
MDLLRRAFTEHPVASWTIVMVEVIAFLIVVWVLAGRVIVPFAGLALALVAVLRWRRRRREAGPTLD